VYPPTRATENPGRLADNLAGAKEMMPQVKKAFRRCRSSYQTNTHEE
jgi:hypothetical protein